VTEIPHGRIGHLCSTLCGAANPHICSNPDCDAWVDADHKRPLCPVCKEAEVMLNSETCGSPKCEKFMGEYEFGLL